MLKSINLHCSDFCLVLDQADQFSWIDIVEWLHIAASVKHVEVDTIQHDSSFGYCSAADHYQLSREELLTTFITHLSVFSFVWGALEAALNVFRIPQHPDRAKRGKISDACRYLTSAFATYSVIAPYHEEVTAFREAVNSCSGYNSVESRFKAGNGIGAPGIGLYAVYKVRNLFAHGSIAFPQPDEEHRPISAHADLITHATRIVLLSLQMLFLAHYRNCQETVEYAWNRDFEYQKLPLPSLLRTFQFVRFDDDDQLELSIDC